MDLVRVWMNTSEVEKITFKTHNCSIWKYNNKYIIWTSHCQDDYNWVRATNLFFSKIKTKLKICSLFYNTYPCFEDIYLSLKDLSIQLAQKYSVMVIFD